MAYPSHLQIDERIVDDVDRVGDITEEFADLCAEFSGNTASCSNHYHQREYEQDARRIIDAVANVDAVAHVGCAQNNQQKQGAPPETAFHGDVFPYSRQQQSAKERIKQAGESDENLRSCKTPTADDRIGLCRTVCPKSENVPVQCQVQSQYSAEADQYCQAHFSEVAEKESIENVGYVFISQCLKKECVAMLLAGGQGSRLHALTSHVAKPAVPFGGKYRIIDFPLSNCINSGIDTVGVLTQYRPLELNAYIGNGEPWDLDRSYGGVHILPPYVKEGDKGTWYKGTANAIYQNIGFLDLYDPDYVVILSGDHIYKMDYADMVDLHKKTGAACTISVLEVTLEEATRFGIMNVDENDQVYEFEEKPKQPKSNLASMGIYIFTWSKLREYLIADEADEKSSNDFGKNIIPAMLDAGEKMTTLSF